MLTPVHKQKRRGGVRPGAGAKAVDGATGVERVTICLTPAERAQLKDLGGSAWVRQQIRDAAVGTTR